MDGWSARRPQTPPLLKVQNPGNSATTSDVHWKASKCSSHAQVPNRPIKMQLFVARMAKMQNKCLAGAKIVKDMPRMGHNCS